MKAKVYLGTISQAMMLNEDLIPAFADELQRLRGALPKDLARDVRAFTYGRLDYDASELVNELIDALNEYAPDYCYFGAHPSDGADFGFRLHEDWEQLARDDDVLFVSDLSEVHRGFRGLVAHVNDHGNATLHYVQRNGALREIWSIV